MPQKITTGFRALVDAAEREVETLSVEDAVKLHGRDDVVFVDLRDPRELEREGRMPGAFHCTRGMLEFWIDPESPYHKPQFAQDKRFVFFCAGGWRSALAAQTAQRMGLKPVAHIAGGFGAWKKAGGPVEAPTRKRPRREAAFARLIGAISKIRLSAAGARSDADRCNEQGTAMALSLVIGNKNYSSWSFRPWIAMRNAGIPFSETVISLDAPEFKPHVTQDLRHRQGAGAG